MKNRESNNGYMPSPQLKDTYFKTLSYFCDTYGVSSREGNIRNAFKKVITPFVDNFIYDNLGSITGVINSKSTNQPKIQILTHMDEIGFLVKEITSEGYLKIVPVGGWWPHTLLAQRLVVVTHEKQEYTGIVGSIPIHVLPRDQFGVVKKIEDLYLDLGFTTKKQAVDAGIRPGDPVVRPTKAIRLNKTDFVAAKAVDNRVSVTILYETFRILNQKKNELKANVFGTCTVQEEVGLRGARTSTFKINPNIAIVVDTTISYDWINAEKHLGSAGKGIAISLLDRTCVCNPHLVRLIDQIATKNNIKFYYEGTPAGGTDAGEAHLVRDGVITAIISIPTRYLHTHNEVCSLNDIGLAVKLLTEFILAFNGDVFKKLKEDTLDN